MSRVLCIYHGNCADGFGAAWVVNKVYNRTGEFHAGVYGKPPPDVTGKHVIMVDFSYKRPVLEAMLEKCESMVILDHHKTAKEDLEGLQHPKLYVWFDMNKSGALLAWEYFFPEEPVLKLIQHISDRDLWQFKLPKTRAIQANLFSFPYDFETWTGLMNFMETTDGPRSFAREGDALERKHFKDIHELLAVGLKWMWIGGERVPVCNLPYTMASDACHIMCEQWDGVPFAASYYHKAGHRVVFSLRSLDTGMDVSAVAKRYGGGGHAHAAGFEVSTVFMDTEFVMSDDETHPYQRKEKQDDAAGESST